MWKCPFASAALSRTATLKGGVELNFISENVISVFPLEKQITITYPVLPSKVYGLILHSWKLFSASF